MEAPSLHRLTLRFESDALEGEFQASTRTGLPLVRVALLLGIALYGLFGILDRWMVPEHVHLLWSIRALVCLVMGAVYALSFSSLAPRWSQLLFSAVVLSAGLGIVGMIWIAEGESGFSYYAGLILVIFYAHGLVGLRFVAATANTAVVAGAYLFVAVDLNPTPGLVILNNSFFLMAAQVIGMFVSYALELNLRRVFWQRLILTAQRSRLEQEDARKSAELEDARRLQRAMLPACVIEVRGLDMCFSMETASEVGGDYYDYVVADDGTLNVTVGDATGHGMKAGILVGLVKALFATEITRLALPDFLQKASATIRQMNLGALYMSLMLVRVRDRFLTISSAGMPPAYLYRAATGRLEEIRLAGLPLGGPYAFPYGTFEARLKPGDTLLLLSDGMPELFNERGELFDYGRAKDAFLHAAGGTSDDIVHHLRTVMKGWRNGACLADDVTLAVLRVLDDETAES